VNLEKKIEKTAETAVVSWAIFLHNICRRKKEDKIDRKVPRNGVF
jgi:hypothetical protein